MSASLSESPSLSELLDAVGDSASSLAAQPIRRRSTHLPPVAGQTFESYHEMRQYIRAHASSQGFHVTCDDKEKQARGT